MPFLKKRLILFSLSLATYLTGLTLALLNRLDFINQDKSIVSEVIVSPLQPHFYSILFNNVKVIFLLISGATTMGISTVFNLLFNGLLLGIMLRKSIGYGIVFSDFIILTFPHGIFEIPAIIIAGAAGFKIPYEVTRYLAGRKDQILTRQDIKEYLTLALISIILIIIAA